ncbi:MAG: ABC transporter ATP-binding protein [Candidatus Omnitrophota bacterium]|nr:MAG: ABC transporter ATP-binding protein [Candidatus Omnitrophota bacterium]
MNLLHTQGLKVYFRHKEKTVKALDGVDIFLAKGITTALAGESGCGKTTLARTILRFQEPCSGKIYFQGKDIALNQNLYLVRKNIQIVFQNPFLSLDPRYTVFASLYETLGVFKRMKKRESKFFINQILRDVELNEDVLYRYPHQLSGGQIQRVCIGRSLINHSALVILDEPTSSLDITTSSKIIRLLERLQQDKAITFLFISHNLKLIKRISQFCFIMYYGKIVEAGPTDLVYNKPLHPYTKLLKEASLLQLKSLPDSEIPEAGCAFLPRCSQRRAECKKGVIKKEAEAGHFAFCNLYK